MKKRMMKLGTAAAAMLAIGGCSQVISSEEQRGAPGIDYTISNHGAVTIDGARCSINTVAGNGQHLRVVVCQNPDGSATTTQQSGKNNSSGAVTFRPAP